MPGFKPISELILTEERRAELTRPARRRKTPRGPAQRAAIVPARADEPSISAAARVAGVTRPTAEVWRERFVGFGPDCLSDGPRSGAPRKIGDDRHRGGRADHAGGDPPERDPPEHAGAGRAAGPEPRHGRPHPAGVRVAAAPVRDVRAVDRPPFRRQGAGRGGPVHEPVCRRRGVPRGREKPVSGPRTLPARAADDAGPFRTADARPAHLGNRADTGRRACPPRRT